MIKVEGVKKSFGTRVLFSEFNLNIEQGEFIIFSGVSGCGKTTLLNIIGALEPVDEGKIYVDGLDISLNKNKRQYFRDKVGFLFQNFALVEDKTVEKNLEFIKKSHRGNVSIVEALEQVGLKDKLKNKVYTLSGGEQQRVALARLMIKPCNLILADEPTGSLDRNNANIVMGILHDLNKQGKTVIVVTHDEYIKKMGKRVIDL